MNGILGMIQLAHFGPLEADQQECLDVALSSGRALVRILNDILDLTSVEKKKLTLQNVPFLLRKCVSDTVALLSPEAIRKGLQLNTMVASDVPQTLIGDQVRLTQVLTNLVGNAVKFTEQGTVAVRITAGPLGVTFTVTDTGIGIPCDKQGLIFDPFSQADDSNTRQYGGTGLGLAISKEIVELMGGTITLESIEEQGSAFSFTLPHSEAAQSSAAPHAGTALPGAVIASPGQGGDAPRILIAEDDHTNRAVLQMTFKQKKYLTDTALNGLQAVEKWENGTYDLIIMDVQMPVMDGIAATRAIREKEQEHGGHTPILGITAHAFPGDEARCLAAGMDKYLSKPVDLFALIAVVVKLANNRNAPP